MRKTAQIFIFVIGLFFIFPSNLHAQEVNCNVTISPDSANTSTYTSFSFNVENTGSTDIGWVTFQPDSNFTLVGYESDWTVDFTGDVIGFRGGSIPSGNSKSFVINATTESSETVGNWQAMSSESYGGGLVGCSGSPSVSITTYVAPPAPVISNATISVSSNEAIISWVTDISSTTVVSYGLTSGYGGAVSTASGTSHSVSITGLTPSTIYHYQLQSAGTGGTTTSTDATFTTGAAGVTTTVTTTVTVTNTTTTTVTNTNTITQTLRDTTPPAVRFLDDFKKIYEEAPLVDLKATDGSGIARLEYTIDGTNYLPIDIESRFGDKTITTNFVPDITEDGDYTLVVRAIDTSGNKVNSKEVKFTIDRLPPRVGPLTVMAGPIVINGHGFAVGVEYKFILSSAGGPNKITMSCGGMEYDFQKNKDIGVWTTKIKFLEADSCIPEITAIDGAGNIEVVKREELTVNKLGRLENGILTVYWYDDYEKKFVMWDSLPYGQTNPIDTRQMSGYSLLLPKGKYYLEAKSLGKRTSVSNIIDVNETVLINDDWELSPIWKFWQISKAWPMITLVKEEKIITPEVLRKSEWQDVNFELPKAYIGEVSTLDIKGKNSVISLLASWHPTTNNVLKVMDELSKNKYSVYPTLIHENQAVANAVKRRGGYNLNIYSDPDGELITKQKVSELPVVWIVDRFGQVIKQKSGNIDYDEITNLLNSLN